MATDLATIAIETPWATETHHQLCKDLGYNSEHNCDDQDDVNIQEKYPHLKKKDFCFLYIMKILDVKFRSINIQLPKSSEFKRRCFMWE